MKNPLLSATLAHLLLTAAANTDPPQDNGPVRPLLVLRAHGKMASCVRFSPDGTRLATGGTDNRVALWDAAAGKKLLTLGDHSDASNASLSFSPDGKRLAAWGRSPAIKIWDVATGKPLLTLPSFGSPVFAHVAFNSDGHCLASLGPANAKDPEDSHGVLIWDARSGKQVAALRGKDTPVCFAYAADGKRLAAGGVLGSVTVWELATSKPALTVKKEESAILGTDLSRDGRWLATAGRDGMVRVWKLPSGRVSWEARGYRRYAIRAVFSLGGRWLASAGINLWPGEQPPQSWAQGEGAVILWDAAAGERRGVLRFGKGEAPYDLDWSPDGSRLATAHGDGTVKVWSVESLLGRSGPTR